jgi:hypothetical protein
MYRWKSHPTRERIFPGLGVPKGCTGSPEGKREKLDAILIVLDQTRRETDEKVYGCKGLGLNQ